jgi:hypothetical protein
MIQRTIAVVIDFSSLTRWIGYDQSVAVQATMFDLQFWPAGKLWLKAGGGFGFLSYASSWDGYIIDSASAAPWESRSASSSCRSATWPSICRRATPGPSSRT